MLRAGFDPTPVPSLSGLSPTCNPNSLVSTSEEDPFVPSVGGVSGIAQIHQEQVVCPKAASVSTGGAGRGRQGRGAPRATWRSGKCPTPLQLPSPWTKAKVDPGLLLCGAREAKQG